MPHTTVTVDLARVTDWESFHAVFAEAFGFPAFYERNMDAWIDCPSSLDAPCEGMTEVHAPPDGVVLLALLGVRDLAARCPEICAALLEDAAFVNHRNVEMGGQPVLCLSYQE